MYKNKTNKIRKIHKARKAKKIRVHHGKLKALSLKEEND